MNTPVSGSTQPISSSVEPIQLYYLGEVARHLKSDHRTIDITGSTSATFIALSLVNWLERHASRSALVLMCSSLSEARRLKTAIHFFHSGLNVHVLPEFDVSPYSGLYPNERLIAERIHWLDRAANSAPTDVFIAPIMALLQKTIPQRVLEKNTHIWGPNDSVPEDVDGFLSHLGYSSVPLVEDIGSYSFRGGILDIYSPAHNRPVRIELYGDMIESMKYFDSESQRSLSDCPDFKVLPVREILYTEQNQQEAAIDFQQSLKDRKYDQDEARQIARSFAHGNYFHGIDFLLGSFYKDLASPLSFFKSPITLWEVDASEVQKASDKQLLEFKTQFESETELALHPDYRRLYSSYGQEILQGDHQHLQFSEVLIQDGPEAKSYHIPVEASHMPEFFSKLGQMGFEERVAAISNQFAKWKTAGFRVFLASKNQVLLNRFLPALDDQNLKVQFIDSDQYHFSTYIDHQDQDPQLFHIIQRSVDQSLRLAQEKILLLSEKDLFGKTTSFLKPKSSKDQLKQRNHALSFGELKDGDFVVHKLHGIGIYQGLKLMPIGGIDSEFIQVEYKGGDKLYVPIYRIGQIQKYSGPSSKGFLDKLGGSSWAKSQTKVRAQVRDIANDLLKLYAQRAQAHKIPFSIPDKDYIAFEDAFPHQETDDQLKAINDILSDMTSDKIMDRLICGDVGFGKTEVAMRAAFKAAQDGRQVAVIAPTTVLSFQHLQTFNKRYKGWPIEIQALNRFISKADQKKCLDDLKNGKIDIVIGTHRLFSKDVQFKDLGLLIIDEEQKFGVKQKEKIRQLKKNVDTLAMSATPIPRTLNLSLMGIRDLSLIHTAPVDRLPTRTFICKFNKETIKKAVYSEIERGGQVFFLHNKVQSIGALYDELKVLLPDVRIGVGHGQMDEAELESVMLKFFNHEIDVLVCTTIIESGMDIPRANTMFIDKAHQLGLSQLYQLRGRVGRSKTRAYCYLMVPKNKPLDKVAQERLKVIQQNTELGSGIQIAHYDLELRGAGDILGEDQSGNINAVGYELYIELLEEQIQILKGQPLKEELDPEINIKVKALIPDSYISDIRVRLSYYKVLSQISGPEDLDQIEDELRDQFGVVPEEVINLMGIMLIRYYCQKLRINDVSTGKGGIILSVLDDTPLPVEKVFQLTQRADKKYSLVSGTKLLCRMKETSWQRVSGELSDLCNMVP